MRLGSSPRWESQLFLIVISNMLIIPWFDSGRGFWGGIKVKEREQGTKRQLAGRKTCERVQQLQTFQLQDKQSFKCFVWCLLCLLSICRVSLVCVLIKCSTSCSPVLSANVVRNLGTGMPTWHWAVVSIAVLSVSAACPHAMKPTVISWNMCHFYSNAGEGNHFVDLSEEVSGNSWSMNTYLWSRTGLRCHVT